MRYKSLLVILFVAVMSHYSFAQSPCSLSIDDSPSLRGIKLGMTKAEVEAVLGIKLYLTRGETFLTFTKNNFLPKNLSFLFTDSTSRKVLSPFNHKLTTYDEEKMLRDIDADSNLSRIDKEAKKSFISLKFAEGGFEPELSIWMPDNSLSEKTLLTSKVRQSKTLKDVNKVEFAFFDNTLFKFVLEYNKDAFFSTSTKEIFKSLNIPEKFIPDNSYLKCKEFDVAVDTAVFGEPVGNYITVSEGLRISVENVEIKFHLENRATQKLVELYEKAKNQEEIGKKPFKP